MKLYGSDLSPYVSRCRMQLEAKGMSLDLTEPPDGLKSDAFAKINPIQKMPALDDNGLQLPESEVICEYIEDAHPSPSLRPESAADRARMRTISRINDLYVIKPFGPLFMQMNPANRDQEAVNKAIEETNQALDWLEHYVDGNGYSVGNSLTLADCTMAPMMFFVTSLGTMFGMANAFEGRPKLAKFWENMQNEPAAKLTLERMAEGMKAFQQSQAQ